MRVPAQVVVPAPETRASRRRWYYVAVLFLVTVFNFIDRQILPILLGVAMCLTVAVLFAGVIVFAFAPNLNARYGNKLMRWRVILQGVALLLFGLMLALNMG